MAKTREDLLISPRYLISSQNCWWAVCFKAGINIVATEESIFMCWHQEHGLLGSEETRDWNKATLCKPPPPQQTWDLRLILRQADEILPCHIFTDPSFSGILSPSCSPWPSMTFMNIWRVQMQIDVCPYDIIWALQGSWQKGKATQFFEVNTVIHVVVLLTAHTHVTTQRVPKVKTE